MLHLVTGGQKGGAVYFGFMAISFGPQTFDILQILMLLLCSFNLSLSPAHSKGILV